MPGCAPPLRKLKTNTLTPPPTPDPTTQGLNEMRQALDSLGRLQEEVGKLWIELRASNGEHARLVGGWGGRVGARGAGGLGTWGGGLLAHAGDLGSDLFQPAVEVWA